MVGCHGAVATIYVTEELNRLTAGPPANVEIL